MYFDLSFSQFYREGDENLLEFYYSYPDTNFVFKYTDNGNYEAILSVELKITNNSEIIVDEKWDQRIITKDYTKELKQMFYSQNSIYLKPGNYHIAITFTDKNFPSSNQNINFDILIRAFNQNNISISDIEFAKIIEDKDESQRQWDASFDKLQYYVLPNPSSEFSILDPTLLGYYEVYNAAKYNENGLYLIEYTIFDNLKHEQYKIKTKKIAKNDGLQDIFMLPLDSLSSNVYYLNIKVKYPIDNPTDSSETTAKFYYSNPNKLAVAKEMFVENLSFEKSEFATMSTISIEDEIEKVKILASTEDLKLIKKISSEEARRKFLFQFWKSQDKDTTTVLNEARDAFFKRVQYANTYFKRAQIPGWKSDRGRVLLKYGEPNEIIDNAKVDYLNSYYQWKYYDLFGGSEFIFVDRNGFGNFKLVHSTAPNEVFNLDWYDRYVVGRNKNTYDSFNNINGGN